MNRPLVTTGAARLAADSGAWLDGVRVGLLAHPASVLPDYSTLHDRLIDLPDVDLTVLFGPEHGIFATAQDQVGVGESTYRGVPVYSLYGETAATLRPSAEALARCDTLVVDLQDIGARYYTYVYTMAYCLEECARHGTRVIVCDRPNPLGGEIEEGPVLDRAFASFIGRFPMPVRHAKTIGELARLWNDAEGWNADLQVIDMLGWRRSMWFDETGLPFVAPSPNMPTLATATVYPGGCLLEGTNLSEGRGTTQPFETVGAPWLNGRELADRLNQRGLPGVTFRPVEFIPTFHKYAGEVCGGVFVHVTDRDSFRSFDAYVELIKAARKQAPGDFAWRTEPYEFENDRPAFDLLCGTDRIRRDIEIG
ncbi:MAG: DUF1343 domain-containing protein [Candidatus Lernaella stagnicola]|nr:DUF1343 domain-containing protein [Candidatus Lernaella stagnicola]